MSPPDSTNPSPTQEVPKGLRFTERELWESGDENMRRVLARLARTRNSAQNHARELQAEVEKREEVEAERDRWEDAAQDQSAFRAEAERRLGAAESRLSAVEAEVADALQGEEELYVLSETDDDSDGLLAHGAARDALKPIRQLLRDKGTGDEDA